MLVTSAGFANGARSSAAVSRVLTHLARQLAAERRWGQPEGIAAGIAASICRCPVSCGAGALCSIPLTPVGSLAAKPQRALRWSPALRSSLLGVMGCCYSPPGSATS